MNEIKIEKGIPIPNLQSDFSKILIKMESGDSVLIESKLLPNWRSTARVNKIDIITRTINDTQTRIWKK